MKDVYNTSIRKICSSIQISPELSPLADNTALPPVDEDFEDEDSIKCNNTIISDTASFASLSDQSDELLKVPELNGEFLLDIDEWDKIHFIDLHGRERLNRDWTTVFSEKISKLYPACDLKFNNYWFKKSFSRKINSPYFRACAKCKFYNCFKFDFYIDEPVTTNTITIQYIPNGYLSLQHSDGETVYALHLSSSSRRNFGEILQHTSVTNAFHKQFSSQSKSVEYRSGNFSNLKSQECLRQIKSEALSSSRFSNDMITDISITQEYYRNLLSEKPIPGYIQYFVKDPFIIHLYTKRQIEVMQRLTIRDNSIIAFDRILILKVLVNGRKSSIIS